MTLDQLLREIRAGGATLVDVLPEVSYREQHLPGAISLPVDEILMRAAAVLKNLHTRIVVYCAAVT